MTNNCSRSDYSCTSGGYTGSEPWGYYTPHGSLDSAGRRHNCTTYAAYRLAKDGVAKPSWSDNANGWDEKASAAKIPVDKQPAVGAVAQWNSGTAGHVAYVESVSASAIVVTDDMYGVNLTNRWTIARTSSSWPDNFIHFKGRSTGSGGNGTPSNGSGNPFGHLDSLTRVPGGLRAQGWVIDPDTASPIEAHAYSGNGNPGGGNPGAATRADRNRPDVAKAYPGKGSAHGFDVTVPARGPGQQTVCVYGINVGAGNTNPRIGCATLNVSADPYGHLDSVRRVAGGVEARGWAIDPDSDAPIAVHVYGGSGAPGGGPGAPTTANQDRPDVANAYPNYGSRHGFTVFLPTGTQVQTVCAYGINNGPGTNPQIGCQRV